MWRGLIEWWSNWVGDRDMELAIKSQLKQQGYPPGRSRITRFRLAAIERPGWVSVHDFGVDSYDSSGDPLKLFGVARDDARRTTVVRLYEHLEARDQQREAWSEGLILAPRLRR